MKVSIITIVYNNQTCIADCIESVLAQSYPDIEHIVVDGSSTDGTQQIIEKYRDRLAVYVSEPDKGLYDALNKGIRLSTGDIVAILHSDDLLYESTTIAKVVQKFEDSKADLIYANGMYVTRNEIKQVKRIYKAKDWRRSSLNFGWIPLHTTIYVKREIYFRYGLYDDRYSIASDYDISIRWFKNSSITKVFLNEWVVRMRLGGKSTSPHLQKRKSTEDLAIIRRHELSGFFTLFCKIGRKVPQYVIPRLSRVEQRPVSN